MPFSMAADFAELDLLKFKNSNDSAEIKVHKAYLLKALILHPDRGGTKFAFQRLVNAFERLKRRLQEEGNSGDQTVTQLDFYSTDEQEEEYWYKQHYNFFVRAWDYSFQNQQEYQTYFDNWHREQTKAREKYLKLVKSTSTTPPGEQLCMFCGSSGVITKKEAEAFGLDWQEYCAHPEGYKTCWPCKEGNLSVVSEKTCLLKFNKKLSVAVTSNTGFEYNPFFAFLQESKRCFHQTTHNKEITYYWYPDLEMEAYALGWKPRGKKKQQEGPWVRKDLSVKRKGGEPKQQQQKEKPVALRKRKSKEAHVQDSSLMVTPDSKRKRRGKREKDMHYPEENEQYEELL